MVRSCMVKETSWVRDFINDYLGRSFCQLNLSGVPSDEESKEVKSVSIDLVLPDDLLEQILGRLPLVSIIRASSVCRRWYEIIKSTSFLRYISDSMPQKPWYFMFIGSDAPVGCTYDPILRKWYNIPLPCIETPSWSITSSCGLVAFMDNVNRSELYVCNPITRRHRKLAMGLDFKVADYDALAISVNRLAQSYIISIVKSNQVSGNFLHWNISIRVYDSITKNWTTCCTELLTGWRGGDEGVICDGVLYFLIYTTTVGVRKNRHGLIFHNLSDKSEACNFLITNFIPVPCSLTCGRLMNLKEKLVMVGGIGKRDRADIIKGIGIWVLNGRELQEVARMPHKFLQGFGELDDVFASSGINDLVYIQCYGSPLLLAFDMTRKQWNWTARCPVTKKFPLQLFSGFSFSPCLQIEP